MCATKLGLYRSWISIIQLWVNSQRSKSTLLITRVRGRLCLSTQLWSYNCNLIFGFILSIYADRRLLMIVTCLNWTINCKSANQLIITLQCSSQQHTSIRWAFSALTNNSTLQHNMELEKLQIIRRSSVSIQR